MQTSLSQHIYSSYLWKGKRIQQIKLIIILYYKNNKINKQNIKQLLSLKFVKHTLYLFKILHSYTRFTGAVLIDVTKNNIFK